MPTDKERDREREVLDDGEKVEVVPVGVNGEKQPISPEREETGSVRRKAPMDANIYATKKNVAQGMMDIALLTANASQLKYVLGSSKQDYNYYINITFISLSLVLQVVVGVLLLLNSRYNINKMHHQPRADLMNNLTIVGIFLITVVNILAASFNGA